nr:hypothetical protein Iba_chr01cCG1180 [Ipomoea batatas]
MQKEKLEEDENLREQLITQILRHMMLNWRQRYVPKAGFEACRLGAFLSELNDVQGHRKLCCPVEDKHEARATMIISRALAGRSQIGKDVSIGMIDYPRIMIHGQSKLQRMSRLSAENS